MSGVEFVPQLHSAAEPSFEPPQPLHDGTPAPKRQRLGRRSLTTRLVLMVVTVLVVLVAATGLSTFLAFRSFLYTRLDQQLTPLAVSNADEAQTLSLHAGADSSTGFGSFQKVWVAVLRPDGTPSHSLIVHEGLDLEDMRLRPSTARRIIGNPDAPATVTTRDGDLIRVSVHQIVSPAEGPLYVATGVSTGDISGALHQLLGLELLVGAGAVAIALIATYGGVRISLRGLRRVTSTAQEVAAELSPSGAALQRRVPVTEDGTEIAQLTEAINTLLASTETQFASRVASEERMRQFLADASHELRTPLTSIRGYAELARMQRAAGQADADNLDRIESEGTRMSRLVEDLLLLARGDAAGAPAQSLPIEVGELLGDAVSGARAAFPERSFQIDAIQPGLRVLGDPDQLVRVIRNLLTNAAVHTRPGPPIRARAVSDGRGVALQIVDGGPGLPPEEAAHVFERFWRADKARTRARGGSGLGLAIVATIIAAHGGTVRFDSSVEAGTTVTVWLPAAP